MIAAKPTMPPKRIAATAQATTGSAPRPQRGALRNDLLARLLTSAARSGNLRRSGTMGWFDTVISFPDWLKCRFWKGSTNHWAIFVDAQGEIDPGTNS